MADYAVIAVGGKQYRVREGERLLVDRLKVEAGETFNPDVLAVGGDKTIADGGTVTARVEEHLLGKKIVVFTYRAKKDSKKKRGHRSRLSRIQIESIAGV
jgi:large subunit ribosomal protein L21